MCTKTNDGREIQRAYGLFSGRSSLTPRKDAKGDRGMQRGREGGKRGGEGRQKMRSSTTTGEESLRSCASEEEPVKISSGKWRRR